MGKKSKGNINPLLALGAIAGAAAVATLAPLSPKTFAFIESLFAALLRRRLPLR